MFLLHVENHKITLVSLVVLSVGVSLSPWQLFKSLCVIRLELLLRDLVDWIY